MNSSDILEQQIKALIADKANIAVDTIKLSADFNSLGFDSLDNVEMVMKLEEELGSEISMADADSMKTVQDVVNYFRVRGIEDLHGIKKKTEVLNA